MAALGDKIGSTILAQAANVPTIPWSGSGVAIDFSTCNGIIPPEVYDEVRGFMLMSQYELTSVSYGLLNLLMSSIKCSAVRSLTPEAYRVNVFLCTSTFE